MAIEPDRPTSPSASVSRPRKPKKQVTSRKRSGRLQSAGVIRQAATTLFLQNGYLGTSMDDIAALAKVSKQTVYTHFADKERLFNDLVTSITETADDLLNAVTRTLEEEADHLDECLRGVARMYVATVMAPQRLQLRRLVIGESSRFPDMAKEYYARAPERFFEIFAAGLERFAERGLLNVPDPARAARHFAALVLWIPVDRALFVTDAQTPNSDELVRLADAAVEVFLAAYARR
jgi:TetR/AcrR family transcriptional regulator, mexJK operon transcriptional repressor